MYDPLNDPRPSPSSYQGTARRAFGRPTARGWSFLTYLQQATVRRERAHRRIHRSDLLAYSAWQRIARSYQRITALPPIAGGADDELRDRIRARLADGALPRVDGRAWAGKGEGTRQCACCDGLIMRMDSEYEPQVDSTLHAHASCYTVWLAESIGAEATRAACGLGRSAPFALLQLRRTASRFRDFRIARALSA